MIRLVLIAVTFMLAQPLESWGHARSTSFSYWSLDDGALSGRFVIPWLEVQQAFPDLRSIAPEAALDVTHEVAALGSFFAEHVQIQGCTNTQWTHPAVKDAALELTVHGTCGQSVPTIRFDLTFDYAPSHVHLVRFEQPGRIVTGVVTSGEREWTPGSPAEEDTSYGFTAFVRSGFEHILAGADHLFFLLALMLLASSLRSLALLATGFTLAHSASLAIAVFGLSKPDTATIEALIGFTVAFSAVEVFLLLAKRNGDAALEHTIRWGYVAIAAIATIAVVSGWLSLQPMAMAGVALFTASFLFLATDAPSWRWLLVFLFGFVHGFGFAGPLLELSMDRTEVATGLLGFNLGVEIGQLAFLAVVWPVISLSRRYLPNAAVESITATVILAAGMMWFLLRAL